MFALSECVDELFTSLPPHPIPKDTIDQLTQNCLTKADSLVSTELRRTQLEYLLREEVYKLAERESTFTDEPDSAYYEELCGKLDVILSFTEHDAFENTNTFLLSVLQDLLETQTVASCSHVFSWIEKRSSILLKDMVPQKGKALVLLRALNDLLRRLSKTGNTTTFCGRISTFLSSVFPLGERSGVNLRGEYGPQWEGVAYKKAEVPGAVVEEKMDVDVSVETEKAGDAKAEGKIEVPTSDASRDKSPSLRPSEKTEEEKKEELYNTFWSLQLPFSKPTAFTTPGTLESFKSAVNAVLPVIKEATIKERAMMGSKAVTGSLKRKRDAVPVYLEVEDRKYFFAKFLTSPELLDLEIADTQFRRQFLFQLIILLSHLLLFTKAEKQNWVSPKTRAFQMDFTLQPDDAKWVQDTLSRAFEEMRQTTPNGRIFAETVQTILERDRNWIRWKHENCYLFDKEPYPRSLVEETAGSRQPLKEPFEGFKHKYGCESLTEIWAMGYRDLHDLESHFNPGEVKNFVSSIERENARIKMRKTQLEKQAQKMQEARARAAAAAAAAKPAAEVSTPAPTPAPAPAPTPVPAPVAPVPQRGAVPPPATSPPLHPSLPAKPGTQPASLAAPSQPSPAPSPTPAAAPTPAPAPAPIRPPELTDSVIIKSEETKQLLSWQALRLARDNYLHLFGRIGNGDVIALAQEIEKEKERIQRGDSVPANAETNPVPNATESASLTPASPPQGKDKDVPAEGEKQSDQEQLNVGVEESKSGDDPKMSVD